MKTWTPLLLALAATTGTLRSADTESPPGLSPEASAPTPPAKVAEPAYVSPWVSEVTKLVEANVDTGVVLEFINGAGTFGLTSPQIISLTEQGVSSEVVTAMIQHDAEYASGYRVNPPAPPVRHIFLRPIPPRKPGEERQPNRPLPQSESIVNPSPAPELWLEHYFTDPEPVQVTSIASASIGKAVREPAPVRLTNTILVHRGVGRVPNNYSFESFPADTLQP